MRVEYGGGDNSNVHRKAKGLLDCIEGQVLQMRNVEGGAICKKALKVREMCDFHLLLGKA